MLRKALRPAAIRAIATVGAVLLVVTGCSASVAPVDPGAAESAVAALEAGQADSTVAGEITELVVKQCMMKKGYPDALTSHQAIADQSSETPLSPTVADAKNHGYGYTRSVFTSAAADQGVRETSEEYSTALFGADTDVVSVELPGGSVTSIPSTGCFAQGRSAVYGDLKTYLRLTTIETDVRIAVRSPLDSDTAWQSATDHWKQCMRQRGFNGYDTPFDARDAVYQSYSKYYSGPANTAQLQQIRKSELQTSLADAQCAAQFDLKAVWKAGVARSSQQFLSSNAADILEWRTMVETAAKRGRELLEGK